MQLQQALAANQALQVGRMLVHRCSLSTAAWSAWLSSLLPRHVVSKGTSHS